jgi:hypothetical protein
MSPRVLEQGRMRLRLLAVGAVSCACCSTGAHAQSGGAAPAGTGQRQFHVSTSLSVLYDDNFARSGAEQARLRHLSPHEVTFRPRINLDIAQPLGRQLVYLNGNFGYVFHKENQRLDRGQANLNGGYAAKLGFCQATVDGNFTAAQAELETLDTIATKNLLKSTRVAVGAQCGAPQGFSGGVQVSRGEVHNSAQLQRVADSTVQTLGLQASYANATLGSVGLFYSYANSELPNRIIPGRPVGDGFFTQTVGVSLNHRFGTRISVGAQVGRTSVKREFAPPGVDAKFNSTTYSANAGYRFGDRLTVQLQGNRAVVPTGRAGKLYDIATSGHASATYNLGSRYALTLAETVADVKSNADTSLPVPIITSSRTYSTLAAISYRQSRRASLSLNVRYDDRTANLHTFDYTATQVGVTAEIGF